MYVTTLEDTGQHVVRQRRQVLEGVHHWANKVVVGLNL